MKAAHKKYWKLIGCLVILSLFLVMGCTTPPPSNEETITIGALLPLSGKNAVYGIEIKNAILLAQGEINSTGGINGKRLEVIFEDDQAEPSIGTSGMQKLVNIDKVPVVLGSWVSGVVVASAPVAEQDKVIVMAIALSPTITSAGDYIFRIQPSATFYTKKSAEFLKEQGLSTAAVLLINNEFGLALKDSFVTDFESRGGSIVGIETYAQGDTDFRSQLTKIKNENPEVVFIPGYQDTIDVIKQMNELGMESTILAGPPFESQSAIAALGALAEGVIYAYHFVAGKDNPKAIHYEQAYLQQFEVPTGGFAPMMYDAVHIIANTLRKCEQNTDCIKEALYEIEYDGIVGTISFDENGDPIIPIVMKTVRNGKFVAYE